MLTKIYLILFLLTSFGISYCFGQAIITGKVIKVDDGDTITILDPSNSQKRIRLYGIDCPESSQDYGQVAKKFTSNLCFRKHVTVFVKDFDKYGRTIGIVYTPDQININLSLLEAGLAWHYVYFDASKEFAQAESLAKSKKLGLWIQDDAVAPWVYRRNY